MWATRTLTESDAERVDDLGFLDPARSPQLRPTADLLTGPVAWVLGRPWIGKSTVAVGMVNHLRSQPDLLPGVGSRVCLTRLSLSTAEGGGFPPWWDEWVREPTANPAVWLIDGLDEAIESQRDRLERLTELVEAAPDGHLRRLRLVLFSRPYAELGDVRNRLIERYRPITSWDQSYQFWLTKLDRAAAATLVGAGRFAAVENLIRRNHLQPVAGYPAVLNYLRAYHQETDRLTLADVWRGVLTALIGERQSNRSVSFRTTHENRYRAARRIAAVLTLTRREAVREYSPDHGQPTVDTLFLAPDSVDQAAVRDACRSALFTPSGEPVEYRFVQRNAQDWLAAFALAELPLPALRSALSSAAGSLSARMREVARLVAVVRSDPDARAVLDRLSGGLVLPSDAIEPTLAESLRALDQLETLAAESPWGLRLWYDGGDDLARLRADGLGVVLATRLRDSNRPPRVKRLLLDVALANAAAEAADAAVGIVLDGGQDDELRYDAVWLITRLGGDEHLQALERPVGEGTSTAEIDCRLRGVLIRTLLSRRRWTCARAALHAPAVKPLLIDSRGLLLDQLAKDVSLADARQLLPRLRELWERHAEEFRPFDLSGLLDRVVGLVLGEVPPADADLDTLIEFVRESAGDDLGGMRAREITQRLRPITVARRRLYRLELTADERQRANAFHLLGPEDWEWVRDQALGPLAGRPMVWEHAYWAAVTARQGGLLPDERWETFCREVDIHAPGVRSAHQAARERYERMQAEAGAERREAEARNPRRRPLSVRVEELLARSDVPAAEVMRGLGWLCFSPPRWNRDRGSDEWGNLPSGLQQRVLDACCDGLLSAEPTPIPAGPFSGPVLYEGEAFAATLAACDGWPPREQIRRWLPTALFARMSGDWAGPITACAAVSATDTELALLDAIDLHARRGGGAFVLRQIPADHWTTALTTRLAELSGDDAVFPGTRRELIEHLATRDPDRTDPIAAAWAARPVTADDADQLRACGRNLLVVRRPTEVLELIEAEVATRGPAALEELPNLYDRHGALPSDGGNWPVTAHERLARLLLRAYPVATDPDQDEYDGSVPPHRELRELRDRIVSALLYRPSAEADAALDRLAALDPQVKARVDSYRVNARAAELLPRVGHSAGDPDALTVRQAVRLLDRAGYRLVRSTDDLLDAVIEALGRVDESIAHDLPMLYSAPGTPPRTHLHEDALQAYLRRRLLDELGRMCDGVEVSIFREDQIGFRQRLDLRITASCLGGAGAATVVVEIKWSTNAETRSGLVEQLGERYLLGERLTHGVFLVGWSGTWRPGDGTGENTDRDALIAHLTAQRDNFCGVGRPGAGLRIEPFVLDARWSR